jgi:release factor glutamine methyltransferase
VTIKPGDPITWMGLSFETNEEVLVPRPETELLARTALELLPPKDSASAIRVIDMCCGAGNLACALAHRRPDIHVWATDLTDACVALARRNVARHELGGRVTVCQGDLFAGLSGLGLEGTVDLVVCNPPYISTAKLAGDSAHLLSDQPREAFDAGPYGFAIHKRMISESLPFFRGAAWLAMEIGLGQEKQIESLFSRVKRWEPRRLFNNDEGAPRAVAARLSTDTSPS